MTDRISLDNLTSDQLDQLYADLDQAETDLARYAEAESADAAAGSYALRAEGAEEAVAGLAQALRLTREYVGADLLPAVEGWSWYDALRRWAPHELDDGQAPAAGCSPATAETEPNNPRTTPDNPAASSDPHIYLSTGCYHGDHAYCQAMTGLNGAKRPASCKKCGAKCVCPCHQQAPAVPECGPACADQHAYDWTCEQFAGVDDSDPADLTGYLAPDPPIGCLTVTAEPTPSQRPDFHAQLAAAIRTAACDGSCDQTEDECARQRIQPIVWHHGRLAEVSGSPEQFADVVLTLLYQEWPWLRAEAEEREQQDAGLAAITAEAARRGVVSIGGIRNIVKGIGAADPPPVTS